MTSITIVHTQELDKIDENTSDDSLIMPDSFEEHAPLLNINDDDLLRENTCPMNDIPLRIHLSKIHCHVPEQKHDHTDNHRLIIVLILCIVFMAIEIVGGILSNSTAIITDAAHMCVDATSFIISLVAIYLSKKQPTNKLSFGYIRAEVLGALASVLTIWLATGILVYMAIERCINQTFEVQTREMIIVASCGVLFNIIMFFVLHANLFGKHSHHCHGHSHESQQSLVVDVIDGYEQTQTKNSKRNINIQAAIIHVIGDFVQSIGVLLAAILIRIKPEYKLADPICTFIFSILVLITTLTIMRDIVLVLMEGVPANINYKSIVHDLVHIPGVRNAHNLHIWSLSLQKNALSVHIAIDNEQDYSQVFHTAQELLRTKHSITQSTIQIEPYDEQIMTSCESCRRLYT